MTTNRQLPTEDQTGKQKNQKQQEINTIKKFSSTTKYKVAKTTTSNTPC